MQIRTIRGFLLVWSSSDVLSVYNTSFLDRDELNPPQHFEMNHVKNSKNPMIRVLRLTSGGFYIAVSGNNNSKLVIFDTSIAIVKTAPAGDGFNIDLGYVRFFG